MEAVSYPGPGSRPAKSSFFRTIGRISVNSDRSLRGHVQTPNRGSCPSVMLLLAALALFPFAAPSTAAEQFQADEWRAECEGAAPGTDCSIIVTFRPMRLDGSFALAAQPAERRDRDCRGPAAARGHAANRRLSENPVLGPAILPVPDRRFRRGSRSTRRRFHRTGRCRDEKRGSPFQSEHEGLPRRAREDLELAEFAAAANAVTASAGAGTGETGDIAATPVLSGFPLWATVVGAPGPDLVRLASIKAKIRPPRHCASRQSSRARFAVGPATGLQTSAGSAVRRDHSDRAGPRDPYPRRRAFPRIPPKSHRSSHPPQVSRSRGACHAQRTRARARYSSPSISRRDPERHRRLPVR